MVLCSLDLTLERVVSREDGAEEIIPDEYHECRDWSQADKFMQDRWKHWLKTSGSNPELDLRISPHDPHTHNHGH
jgi:hypothetical protein